MNEQKMAQLQRRVEELSRALDLFQQCQEEEYRTLALDLHDELEPTLSAMLQHIRALRAAGVPAGVQKNLDALGTLANHAIADVDRISRILRPNVLETKGLFAALAWFCDRFSEQTGIHCTFSCEAQAVEMPQKSELLVYRILQEAFNNAYQHSGADEVHVSIRYTGGVFTLTVCDNGCGFDPEKVQNSIGLAGMRERACMLGGNLAVQSAPGRGTQVTLSCCMDEQQDVKLTERENEVLRYVARGYTCREIGEMLYLSMRTVETHRMHLMRKLGVRNRSELVQYAIRRGLL